MDTIRPLQRLEALANVVPDLREIGAEIGAPDGVGATTATRADGEPGTFEGVDVDELAGRLVDVLRAHGETLDRLESSDVVELLRSLDRLRALLCIGEVDRAAQALNDLFDEVGARPRLSRHDGSPWHLHVDPDDAGWGTWLLASSALALAMCLQEHGRITWGRCEASGCRRYFVGDGRGGARRYCSERCANRARVARHRSRLRPADARDHEA
ncbi:CGNR zinc finger domain-containing protein [Phytoactinopolyspora halophila]|uniref:CGNR zinc finger domain-containing protein n=1 Tax=Phytoactinopolyspora halophila TaxID=1981511 RepID=UPI001B8C7BE5|nr:CGNR zinc finger domain-containing protein [Phytoactinopolyspora halophila]